ACAIADHPDYSEDPASDFYAEAMVVYQTSKSLTPDQIAIARFWSDDPMLSPTPPGHWLSIALQIISRDGLDALRSADLLARLGVAMADAFIGCWWAKYEYDLIRPITYIRRVIDPNWEPLLITPPFPEFPSGHSTLSGASAALLTSVFGAGFAFSDATHVEDNLPERSYPDFWTAATEAANSRLYGGIHFPSANANGLEQGRCIAGYAAALQTRI
ncbi:MAG: vanadium-dependent haloperoxidase, partial [Cypionkella sp.]